MGFLGKLGDFVSDVIDKAKDLVEDLWDRVKSVGKRVLDLGKDLLADMGLVFLGRTLTTGSITEGAKAAIETGLEGVRDIARRVVQEFGTKASRQLARVVRIAERISPELARQIRSWIGARVARPTYRVVLPPPPGTRQPPVIRTLAPDVPALMPVAFGEGVLGSLQQTLLEWLQGITAPVVQAIEDMVAGVRSAIGDAVTEVSSYVGQAVERALGSIVDLLEPAVRQLTSMVEQLHRDVVNVFQEGFFQLREWAHELAVLLGRTVSDVAARLDDVVRRVTDPLSAVVDDVRRWLADAFASFRQAISDFLEPVRRWLSDVAGRLSSFIGGVVEDVRTAVGSITEVVESIPATIERSIRQVREALTQDIMPSIGQRLSEWWQRFWAGMEQLSEEDSRISPHVITNMAHRLGVSEAIARLAADAADAMAGKTPILRQLAHFLLWTYLWNAWIGSVMDVAAATTRHAVLEETRPTLLSDVDLAEAATRGIWPEERVRKELALHGYAEDRVDVLLALRTTVPPEGTVLDWWLRGFISTEQADAYLAARGWTEKDRELLKKAAYYLPPVQDIIRMAVRDAFSPTRIQQFGLLEDVPDEYLEWAEKAGLSRNWALRYWAAHWELPSVHQGYEMFHRRIITREELEALFRAADIAPAWREKLLAASYNPITRVDIRRLYASGLIDEQGLVERYMDAGYSPEDAKLLAEWTVQSVQGEPEQATEEVRQLSRSTIMKLYREGLLRREAAMEMLQQLGYSEESANMLLTLEDVEREQQERRQAVEEVLDQFEAGLITFEQAQDRLAALGLNSREFADALSRLERLQRKRTKLPSLEDLKRFFKSGLLMEDEVREALASHGYARKWIDRYLRLWSAEVSHAASA